MCQDPPLVIESESWIGRKKEKKTTNEVGSGIESRVEKGLPQQPRKLWRWLGLANSTGKVPVAKLIKNQSHADQRVGRTI
jgi:hypothetical protein